MRNSEADTKFGITWVIMGKISWQYEYTLLYIKKYLGSGKAKKFLVM